MALMEYKCPNCGGALGFSASEQEMVCPYCDSEISVEALRAMDERHDQERNARIDWGYEEHGWREGEQDGMAVYSCKSCGGEIVGDETLGASSCPFCGNPVVITSAFSGTLRPDRIIPFKLDKAAALQALQKGKFSKQVPQWRSALHLV